MTPGTAHNRDGWARNPENWTGIVGFRIALSLVMQLDIDPGQLADIEKFDTQLKAYLSGELDPEVFRVFRLNNGIYGQRQGGNNQMVRVKVPYGKVTPEQLDTLA